MALEVLAGIASLQAKQGDTEHALELPLMVLYHSASSHDARNRISALKAGLGAQLTPTQIETIQAHTRKIPWRQL